MLVLAPRTQRGIGLMLIALVAATRGHHFEILHHLPSASWAAFFLAGVYLRPRWAFPLLLAEAALLDVWAVTWGGVSNFCVSPAYGFLLPAYGTLWFAGRWYAGRHRETAATLFPLMVSVLAGAAICELISSGSFYFLSGRFQETTVAEFAARLPRYFPRALSSLLFYVAVSALVHAGIRAASAVAAMPDRSRASN